MRRLLAWVIPMAIGLCTLHPAEAGSFTVTPIIYPGGQPISLIQVNNRGELDGFYTDNGTYNGFVWSNGQFRSYVDKRGNPVSLIGGVSDSGFAAGMAPSRHQGALDAVVVDIASGKTFVVVRGWGTVRPEAVYVNDIGDIVGLINDPKPEWWMVHKGQFTYPHLWIDALNDLGNVVGTTSGYANGVYNVNAFLLSGTTQTPILVPGSHNVTPEFLANSNLVTGQFRPADSHGIGALGFIWVQGHLIEYTYPGAAVTSINGYVGGVAYGNWRNSKESFGMFTYSAGTYTPLRLCGDQPGYITYVSRFGSLLGTCGVAPNSHPFVALCPLGQGACTQ